MEMQKNQEQLWNDCKKVFQKAKNEHTDYLLKDIIEIIRLYREPLDSVADYNDLEYVNNMNASDYITGTNGDNFEILLSAFLKNSKPSLDDIWKMLSQLVWDLSVVVSTELCPNCKCDYISYYTDETKTHLYESCVNCFWTVENGKQIKRPDELYPTTKSFLMDKKKICNI